MNETRERVSVVVKNLPTQRLRGGEKTQTNNFVFLYSLSLSYLEIPWELFSNINQGNKNHSNYIGSS